MPDALVFRNVKKTYPGGQQALRGLSFSVHSGDFFGLLGPNGAGKSTALGILMSLVQKTSGHVAVMGHDVDHQLPAAKAHMGFVPQEFNFNIFETPWDIVMNQAGFYGVPRAQAAPQAAWLLQHLDLWEPRHRPSRTLSGGMKRRLMVARALIHKPQVLLLDEPTAGIDLKLRHSLWSFLQTINAQGTTIILTTHYLEEAEHLCRHLAIIHQGQIIASGPKHRLLKDFHVGSYTLHLEHPVDTVPAVSGCLQISLDTEASSQNQALNVHLQAGQRLLPVLQQLSEQGLEIASIQQQANRLEGLFLSLTQGHS